MCRYLASISVFLAYTSYMQLASLYCYALLGYWYNKKSSFLEECCQLFSSKIVKHWTLTNNSEPILANNDIFLLSNQLTGQTRSGKWRFNHWWRSILYTKSVLHTWLNSRAWDILHVSSFSVGQWIQGSIRTYRENIRKFIAYILLILYYSFKIHTNLCNVRGCTRQTICLMRART